MPLDAAGPSAHAGFAGRAVDVRAADGYDSDTVPARLYGLVDAAPHGMQAAVVAAGAARRDSVPVVPVDENVVGVAANVVHHRSVENLEHTLEK